MSARAVRTSGIVGLSTILIVPASAFLVGWLGPSRPGLEGALAHVGVLFIVMYYALVGCAAFLLWATKQVFNASGYRSADLLIGTVFGLLVFLPPLALPAWAWLSILAIIFGRRSGSLMWRAIGIIYLIATALVVCTTVAEFGYIDIPGLDLLMVCSGLVLLVGWLYHSIALILSAGKMAGTGPADPNDYRLPSR